MASNDGSMNGYRQHLVEARQKAYEDFDKTVFALSGGALGISFAFIDKIVGEAPIVSSGLLLAAWFCWVASLTVVLASFYLSVRALSAAIRRHDEKTPKPERTAFALLTEIANGLGALLFVVGLICMVLFVVPNLKGVGP